MLKKILFGAALAALTPFAAFAQSAPTNIYAAGVSANPGESPSVAGTVLWAHAVNASGTYAGTILDILPQTVKPITVNTNIGAFVAQKVTSIGKFDVYATGSTGISMTGTATGWTASGGGAVIIPTKSPNLSVMVGARVSNSNVSGKSGKQIIPGVAVVWGR